MFRRLLRLDQKRARLFRQRTDCAAELAAMAQRQRRLVSELLRETSREAEPSEVDFERLANDSRDRRAPRFPRGRSGLLLRDLLQSAHQMHLLTRKAEKIQTRVESLERKLRRLLAR